MTRKELDRIVKNHIKWVRGEDGGERAHLSGANLSDADLRGANLSDADLSCADLSCANLRCADLRGVDLRGAHLSGANLSDADLRGADLSGADLSCANLRCADLSKKVIVINGICKWSLRYNEYDNDSLIKIGCESKTKKEWDKWFKTKKQFETKRDTTDFKKIVIAYKVIVQLIELKEEKE